MRPSATAVTTLLIEQGRALILQTYGADSCIVATRIAIDVLDYFGIEARALAVRAIVANGAGTRLLSGEMDPLDACSMGAWSVGVGAWSGVSDTLRASENREGGAGHLVAHLPHESMLLDLSIDQASRPHHGINVCPLVFPVPQEFFAGELLRLRSADGQLGMFYQLDPGNAAYRDSPDWRGTSAIRRELAGRIIRLCRAAGVPTLGG